MTRSRNLSIFKNFKIPWCVHEQKLHLVAEWKLDEVFTVENVLISSRLSIVLCVKQALNHRKQQTLIPPLLVTLEHFDSYSCHDRLVKQTGIAMSLASKLSFLLKTRRDDVDVLNNLPIVICWLLPPITQFPPEHRRCRVLCSLSRLQSGWNERPIA